MAPFSGAAWPVVMVGLDVTQRVNLIASGIRSITKGPGQTNRHLAAAIPLYQAFLEKTNGIDGIYLHDPTAVAYLINPSLFETRRWPIRVETQSISRAKTSPSPGDTDDASPQAWRDRPRVSVCTAVNAAAVIDLLVERLW